MNPSFVAGAWKQQYGYKSFMPNPIDIPFSWEDPVINVLLERATLKLGNLEAFSDFIPDIDFFVYMHIGKEAVKSSRIEGTKTEFDEIFMEESEGKNPEERDDRQEVINYIQALNHGITELQKLPLSFRLFNDIHRILLSSVRWEYRNPGEIRKSQNWIGGSNLQNAFFIPPHQDDLSELLTDFERFLHDENLHIPELIKVAIAHYQFETIHPYLDGNGRMGRLIIILYLIEKKFLTRPVLYISDFFERNKPAYYDALTVVRGSNNIEHFIKFFLTGVIETCESSIATFKSISALKKVISDKIMGFGSRTEKAHTLLKYLFSQPIVTVSDVARELDITFATATTFIRLFMEIGVLHEITGFKKHRIFVFEDYMKMFR